MLDVAILDYQLNNLHSVEAACRVAKLRSEVTNDPKKILAARAIILPGVGAFGEAMTQLIDSGLDACITEFVDSGRPFLGICLGFQLLFDRSEEFGDHKGLGLISGSVNRLQFSASPEARYPVPHVGWNSLKKTASWKDSLLENSTEGDLMYFVHSLYVEPKDKSITLASTQYGEQTYCSVIRQKNIFATQFHPEKSGPAGLNIYHTLKQKIQG